MSIRRDETSPMAPARRRAPQRSAYGGYGVLLLCLLLWSGMALAQSSSLPATPAVSPADQSGPSAQRPTTQTPQPSTQGRPVERPIYLDVVPVAGAPDSVLPADVIAAMAGEALSGLKQATIRMDGQALPAGVRVLRIMYIVHEQPDDSGTTLAASASTELLRTAATDDGQILTYSLYNGLQQTLVQGPIEGSAVGNLRAHFKQELQSRIASAVNGTAAR